MPRLFTGLEIPEDLATDLAMLRGGIYGARWIDVENYHITLRFIGDIDDATARDVHASLEQIRRKPFTVEIETLSSFGGAKPRAIVAKAKPATPLVELQAQQERLLRRIGIPPEPRKFTPHVTLARLQSRVVHGGRRLSVDARLLLFATLRGAAFRPVLVAGLDWRRPLCDRGCLSARVERISKVARRAGSA